MLLFSNKKLIGVVEGGGRKVVPVEYLRRHFRVDALIRLHLEEFAGLAALDRHFVHFNLEMTLNEVGRRYAILPIVVPGRRAVDGQEMLPVVDPGRFRLATCTAVLQRFSIDRVTAEDFVHSLPTIKTVEQLRAALIRRYAKLFPELSSGALIARGCAVTHLRLDALRV